jgi:DNA-binding transcriptional MerR regulator
MRELEKLTALSRATINFYIKEGILPPPEKSAKNMAYYDEDFIEKLKFIEKMRQADFTLNQIRKLVNYDPGTVNGFGLQVMESVNRLLPAVGESAVSLEQLKNEGFSDEDMRQLIDMRIINSIDGENALFPAYAQTVCRVIRYFMDFGIPVTAAQEILLKIKELADLERNIFVKYIRSPMLDRNISPEEQQQEIRRCIESINGLLPILHLQLIKLPNEDLKRTIDGIGPRRPDDLDADAEEKSKEADEKKRESEAQKKEKEAQRKKEKEQKKEEKAQERREKEREREAELREKEQETAKSRQNKENKQE